MLTDIAWDCVGFGFARAQKTGNFVRLVRRCFVFYRVFLLALFGYRLIQLRLQVDFNRSQWWNFAHRKTAGYGQIGRP